MTNTKMPGHIALLTANIIFGINTPISRSLIPEIISPLALTFFRMAGAMFLFWFISLFTRKEHVPSKDILLLFFASSFALVLNQMPFIVGLSMTSSIDASIIVTLVPVISMLLAAIFIKEPITLKKVTGVIIGASGALILILNQEQRTGNGNFWGNLLVLSAVLSYSLYLTLFKNLITRYTPVTLMKWMFLFASILCFPFCYKPLINTDYTGLPADAYLRIAYVVVAATFITYFLIPIGQKALRPTTVSMYNYVQPIVTALAAIALSMDVFSWDKGVSAILVFIGVYFVTTSKSKAQMEAKKKGIVKG